MSYFVKLGAVTINDFRGANIIDAILVGCNSNDGALEIYII